MIDEILHYQLLVFWIIQVYLRYQVKIISNREMLAETHGGGSGGTTTDFDYVNL